jgi:amino acid transporter
MVTKNLSLFVQNVIEFPRNNLNFIAGEVVNPAQNMKKCILCGLSIVTVWYILVIVSYYAVLPPETVKNSTSIAVVRISILSLLQELNSARNLDT